MNVYRPSSRTCRFMRVTALSLSDSSGTPQTIRAALFRPTGWVDNSITLGIQLWFLSDVCPRRAYRRVTVLSGVSRVVSSQVRKSMPWYICDFHIRMSILLSIIFPSTLWQLFSASLRDSDLRRLWVFPNDCQWLFIVRTSPTRRRISERTPEFFGWDGLITVQYYTVKLSPLPWVLRHTVLDTHCRERVLLWNILVLLQDVCCGWG